MRSYGTVARHNGGVTKLQPRKTRRKTSSPRNHQANIGKDFERHNLRILEKSLLPENIVTLEGFQLEAFVNKVLLNRVAMKERKVQASLPPRHLAAEDGPRLVFDGQGNFVLLYSPGFWGKFSQVQIIKDIAKLVASSPHKMDAGTLDRRVNPHSSHGGASTYWNLYHHGPAQQNKHLGPSSSLTTHMGESGARARVEYLEGRTLVDKKINDLIRLVHPNLHECLQGAMLKLRAMEGETGEWARRWPSAFPGLAIIQNRETQLHRDSRGAPYGADFLTVLGEFNGGDLALPDLNLTLEWSKGAACLFDGRTFAHEVKPWAGSNRTCLVSYLWKTSISKLSAHLPTRASTLEELRQYVRSERGRRILCGASQQSLTEAD